MSQASKPDLEEPCGSGLYKIVVKVPAADAVISELHLGINPFPNTLMWLVVGQMQVLTEC